MCEFSREFRRLLSSTDHNFSDAHTGYNVHREAFNEATVISGDLFHYQLNLHLFHFRLLKSYGLTEGKSQESQEGPNSEKSESELNIH